MTKKAKDELAMLAAEVAALATTTAGHRRYPAALRPRILAAKNRYVGSGGLARDFAKQLDVHSATLAFWAEGNKSGKKPHRVKRVRLSDVTPKTPRTSTGVVILANGARIEGLTTSELIEFARGCA